MSKKSKPRKYSSKTAPEFSSDNKYDFKLRTSSDNTTNEGFTNITECNQQPQQYTYHPHSKPTRIHIPTTRPDPYICGTRQGAFQSTFAPVHYPSFEYYKNTNTNNYNVPQ